MSESERAFEFVGKGRSGELDLARIRPWDGKIGHWIPGEDRDPVADESAADHPSGYLAAPDLVDAVNTALILRKPLLLTGNPGTGKSNLAERIAWEFNLGPVLRFEAQSLSEAVDLFYRFDLVRHVAASYTARPGVPSEVASADPREFISFGPLGKAILRSNPRAAEHWGLWPKAFPKLAMPDEGLPSVVLIDEIDKASRDFPNDLLNAIERLEVPLREIPGAKLRVGSDERRRPVIVITSNSERELPAPFLRRCVFFHIPDPDQDTLREIVRARVFPDSRDKGEPGAKPGEPVPLPGFYEEMLDFFVQTRDERKSALGYVPGPSELIDWSNAVRRTLPKDASTATGNKVTESIVRRALSSFSKHRDDRDVLLNELNAYFKSA